MNLEKNSPIQSRNYLNYVRNNACMVTGFKHGCDPHHPIACGLGGTMSGKASDILAFPLKHEIHLSLHADPNGFEERYSQLIFSIRMIERAFRDGVFEINISRAKELAKREC